MRDIAIAVAMLGLAWYGHNYDSMRSFIGAFFCFMALLDGK